MMEIGHCILALQLLYLWRKTPGLFTCTKVSLYLVVMRKISTPLGNDILGAHVVAEPILCKGGSGGHNNSLTYFMVQSPS